MAKFDDILILAPSLAINEAPVRPYTALDLLGFIFKVPAPYIVNVALFCK